MTGAVGSKQLLGSGGSDCGKAERQTGSNRTREVRQDWHSGKRAAAGEWQQRGLQEGRAAVHSWQGANIQGDREATERRNDWHRGEASSFWEAAAAGAAGRPSCCGWQTALGQGEQDATER